MNYNMNIFDIAMRYMVMMLIVILGGVLHSIAVMALAIPFFLAAIMGWCPIFHVLGINHAEKDAGH